MKRLTLVACLVALLNVAALHFTPRSVTSHWDVTPNNGSIDDGGGTWSDASLFTYDNGGHNSKLVPGSVVAFGGGSTGTGGTVTATGTKPIDSLVFNTANGATPYTLSGAMPTRLRSFVTVNDSKGATVSATIGGTTGVTKQGSGTLTLSGANSYSGGTTVSAGQLTAALGTPLAASSSSLGATANALSIASGAQVNLTDTVNNFCFTGAISGLGTINQNLGSGPGVRLGGNNSSFTGTYTQQSTSRYLMWDNANAGSASATWNLDANTGLTFAAAEYGNSSQVACPGLASGTTNTIFLGTLSSTGTATRLGNFANGGSPTGTTTFSVGALNQNSAYAGGIVDTVSGSGAFTSSTVNLTKTGTGTQTLTGTNTYTGSTTISGGTLQVGNSGTSGSLGTGAVVDNSHLVIRRSDTFTLSNNVSGTGDIDAIGGGLIFSGTTSLTGGSSFFTVNSSATNTDIDFQNTVNGPLDLTATSGTGSIGIRQPLGGTTALKSVSMTSTQASSGLTKFGSNYASAINFLDGVNVTTSGNQTYAGNVSLAGVGATSPVVTLTATAGNISLPNGVLAGLSGYWNSGSLTLTTSAGNGNVTLGGNTLQYGVGNVTTNTGTGTTTLNGSYRYDYSVFNGPTLLSGATNFSANLPVGANYTRGVNFNGTLNGGNTLSITLGNGSNSSTGTGTAGIIFGGNTGDSTPLTSITANAGTIGGVTANGNLTTSGAISLTGTGYTFSGTGNDMITSSALTFGNTNGISNSATGGLTFNVGSATNVSNPISGSGALAQSSLSLLTLSGALSYAGTTTVNGPLAISPSGNINDTLSGAFVNNSSVTVLPSASTNPNGNVVLTGAVSGAGTWTVDGASAPATVYTNRLRFGGSGSTNTGQITVQNFGNLWVESATGLGNTTPIFLNGANTTFYPYGGGFNPVIGTLTGSGTVDYYDGGGGNSSKATTLTIGNDNGSGTFSGTVSNSGTQSGPTVLSITKAGTGTQTLSGAGKTYTGTTAVNAGTLKLSSIGNTFVSSTSVASGGILELNDGNSGSADHMILGNGNPGTQITGTGTINATGGGWIQGDYNVFTNFNGILNIQGGTTFGSANTRGLIGNASSPMIVNDTFGYLDLRGAGANAIRVDQVNGGGQWCDTWNGSGAAGDTITIGTNNGSSTFSGATRGAGGGGNGFSCDAGKINLTKVGTGTLTLTGLNSYAGTTTISAGTLQIGGSSTLPGGGTYSLAMTDNGTLQYSSSAAQTLSGVISGSGGITKDTSAASTLTLTGTNTYSGTTAVSAGTFQVGGSGSLGSGSYAGNISIGSGSRLQYSSSSNQILSGPISGLGSIMKDTSAASSLTLSTANTYAGGTTVSAGTLVCTDAAGAGTGTITLGDANTGSNNVAWYFSGGLSPSNSVVVSSSGTGTATIGTNSGGFAAPSGTLTLNRATILNDQTGDRTTFTGLISGNPGTITITGTRVTFSNCSNSFTGNLSVSANSIYQSECATALPTTTNMILNGNSTFRLNGGGIHTINALQGTATDNVRIIAGGSATLSVGNNNGSATFNGVITNGAGSLSVRKNGTGAQVFTGTSAYTGGTTINAGNLTCGNINCFGTGPVTVNAGGTLNCNNYQIANTLVDNGGTILNCPTIFTSSGTYTVPFGVTSIQYLVVAGGGAGGSGGAANVSSAGGGGGGFLTGTVAVTSGNTYTITVGPGGAPVASGLPTRGGDSSIGSLIVATGGGGGGPGGGHGNAGASGGSGGGSVGGSLAGGAGIAGQGFRGGNGSTTCIGCNVIGAAGGGGAGGVGSNGLTVPGNAAGGPGLSNSLSGTAVTYAAGGTGGSYPANANGASGAANTGNGGNGGGGQGGTGGAGGSGIVIILPQ